MSSSKKLDVMPEAEQLASQRPSLSSNEREQVLCAFNQTTVPFPATERIEEVFEKLAARTPGAVAIVDAAQSLTYSELNARANKLARYLMRVGIRHGDCVALLMPRSAQMVVAQLAILKCGAEYLPLDLDVPEERQIFMVQDCGARHVLYDSEFGVIISLPTASLVDCSEAKNSNLIADNLTSEKRATTPAYVMYTSGSTGKPKGVVVPHAAVLRLVINNSYAPIGKGDRIAHCNNPTFDASTFEIWGALLNGARLVIIPKSVVLDTLRFAEVLVGEGVTTLFLTTALFNRHVTASPKAFSTIKYLLFGGEIANPGVVRKLLRDGAPRHLVHVYGPTEATTFATSWPVSSVDDDAISLPIGRPIANTYVYILDNAWQPVLIGIPGEIYIGGPGVACGYLNQPQLTAERFVPDPFSPDSGGRLYRTGDFGRWCSDGSIEFLGRNDNQVKIRGFRIELDEVEGYLASCPGVNEAVVIVRVDAPDDLRLAAYVTLLPEAAVSGSQLRAHMASGLPEYMIPTSYVVVDRLPLTGNGKVDRSALPAPDASAVIRRQYESPRGSTELAVAAIWQEILKLDDVSRFDNFFELGGNSLLGMDLIARLADAFGIQVPFISVFQHPSIEELSRYLEQLYLPNHPAETHSITGGDCS